MDEEKVLVVIPAHKAIYLEFQTREIENCQNIDELKFNFIKLLELFYAKDVLFEQMLKQKLTGE